MSRRGENIYKRKDGRWEGRYIKGQDPETGKRQWGSVYAATYAACKDLLQKAKAGEPSSGRRTGGGTLAVWLDSWLVSRAESLRPSTYMTYYNLIERHIKPELGALRLEQATKTRLERFLLEKRQSGRADGSGGLAQATVRLMASVLTAVIRLAWEENCAPSFFKLELRQEAARQAAAVYTCQEQRQLEDTALRLACLDQNYAAVLLSLWTGLRVGEVGALRWRDVHIRQGMIRVAGTLQRVQNPEGVYPRTQLRIGAPKSLNSCREIPVLGHAVSLLRTHWEQTPSGRRRPEDFVFQRCGRPLEPRALERYYDRAVREAGVPDLKFHALRHTFATRCIEAGMDDKSLSELLGHGSTAITTSIYVHSLLEQKRRCLDKLASYLGPVREEKKPHYPSN